MKRIYLHPVEPEKYPDYSLRAAKAVTRRDLGGEVQFATLRGFPVENGKSDGAETNALWGGTGAFMDRAGSSRLCEIRETIELYTEDFGLGKLLWLVYPTLFARNFRELAEACREHGLYLYDFWGYVPGSKVKKDFWGEYEIPEQADACMKELLGDHFLGYDNGEQDGRYVHALARRTAPLLLSRKMQYRSFQAYFEKVNDAMRNHTATLASLTFVPYFAKEGNTVLIGAETAQALPCSSVWYAFIRGASKQYGLLCFGNASVWNRWGYKDYQWDGVDTSLGYEAGRLAGTSLSLLRRLIYNQYMYNCEILGFEGGWFTAAESKPGDCSGPDTRRIGNKTYRLTPIGRIQRTCAEFVRAHGRPGVMYTPLALIGDFHAGWMPPRQLYSQDIYKVWGNLPYGDGDFQLDCIFSMLFPHYERAGFFRSESGFVPETPYGEIADALLSDLPQAVLDRYSAAVVMNGTEMTLEFYRKLKSFAEKGGRLLVFEGLVKSGEGVAELAPDYAEFFGSPTGTAGVRCHAVGEGSVSVIQEETGLVPTGEGFAYRNEPDGDIPHPYRFSKTAESSLGELFSSLAVVRPDNPRLQYCVDIRRPGEYTVFVANGSFSGETFGFEACEGKIAEVTPLPVEDGVSGLEEFLPRGFSAGECPVPGPDRYAIAAGDCLLFTVKTEGGELREIPETRPAAPDRNLFLSKGYGSGTARDFLLDHPTFRSHFGGLMLPAEYFERLSSEAARKEAHYFKLQNVKIGVDFTRILNHFPDLCVIGNFPSRSEEAVRRAERTLRLAADYGCAFAVFACTRNAENEWTVQEAEEGMKKNFARFAGLCVRYGIRPFLQNRVLELGAEEQYRIGEAAGMGRALNTAYADCAGYLPEGKAAGLTVLSSAAADDFGQLYPANLPCFRGRSEESLRRMRAACEKAASAGTPIVLAGEYGSWDEVAQDLSFFGIGGGSIPPENGERG